MVSCRFVSLKDVSDPSRIAHAAAEALGLGAIGDGAFEGRIFEHLWKARALIVLDNAEHLIGEAAVFIRELLNATSNLHVIVTSREILSVEGEQVLWLGGIDDGLALFTDRASAERPNLELTPDALNAVASVCVKLQGNPLAIELAAARAQSIPPETLARTLDGLPPGATVLGQMVDWSYRLLRPSEQHCFDVISLFEAPFSWEAVDAVACSAGEDALVLLGSLANKSLLVPTLTTTGSKGYYLLEAVREYASQRLRTANEADAVIRRYVDYYLRRVESVTSSGVDESLMIADLNSDWANLQNALRRALDGGLDLERACLGIRRLWRFWLSTGRTREGLYLINRALEVRDLPNSERLELLDAAARMTAASQDFARLEPLAQRLVAERERGGDSKLLGDALFMLATAKHALGEDDEAEALLQSALKQFESSGSRRGMALALGTLGIVIEQQTVSDAARFDQARALLEQSLEIFREEGVVLSWAQGLENLGVLCMRSGNVTQALAYVRKGLALYREHGNNERAAIAHISLADVYLELEKPLQAISELQAGRRVLADHTRGPFLAYYAEAGFKAAVARHAFETAAQLFGFAQGYRKVIRTPLQAGERASIAARYARIEESLGASTLERLLRDGAAMDVPAIDALVASLAQTSGGAPVVHDVRSRNASAAPDLDDGTHRPMIERGHVTLRIEAAAAYPAVFVIAKGAWGKSTALAHCLRNEEHPSIRLRLGPGASTIAQILRLFHRAIASYRTAMPAFPDAAAAEPAARLLEWLSDYRGVIVIEDLHLAERESDIAQVLLDVIAPTARRITWFLLSREVGQLPIGTCVAYGLAGQPIDESDLAFTVNDTRDLAHLFGLSISEHECEAIIELTEGWPLATQLALRARLAAVAMAPLERQAHVERETVTLASLFLREQSFRELSARQQRLLLAASAMPGDVRSDVLRQLEPAPVEELLAELVSKVPMSLVSGGTYRLSRLFKRFLRDDSGRLLEREGIGGALAAAYQQAGDPLSAIQVFLDMRNYDAAIDVLVEHTPSWPNGTWPEVLEAVVSRLPAPFIDANPNMLLARAAVVERRNRIDQALMLLARARTIAGPHMRLKIACAEAALCLNNDQPAKSKPLEEALADVAGGSTIELRAKALLSCAYLDEHRYDDAIAIVNAFAQRIDGTIVDEGNIDIVYWTALAYYRLEDYKAAELLASRMTIVGREPWLVLAQANELRSRIALQVASSFDSVIEHNDAAIAIAQTLKNARHVLRTYLQRRCVLLFYNGDVEMVEGAMNRAHTTLHDLARTYEAVFRVLSKIDQASLCENWEEATRKYVDALQWADALPSETVLARETYIPVACQMMISCLANDGTIKNALKNTVSATTALLDSYRTSEYTPEGAAGRRHVRIAELTGILCQTLLGEHAVLAVVTQRLEERAHDPVADCVRAVVRAIVMAVRMGAPMPHVPRGNTLAFPSLAEPLHELRVRGYDTLATLLLGIARKTTKLAPKGVGLSKSELEVLKQLGSGLLPSAIAKERYCSVETIRAHIKSIFRKLDVKNQAAAIARARSAGLIS